MHFPRSLIAATIAAAVTFSPAQAQSQNSVERAYQMALHCAGTLLSAERSPAKAESAARSLAAKLGQSRTKTDEELWNVKLFYGTMSRNKPKEFSEMLQGCLKMGFAT